MFLIIKQYFKKTSNQQMNKTIKGDSIHIGPLLLLVHKKDYMFNIWVQIYK